MIKNNTEEAVAVLYDIENAPFEMLDYALGKARRFMPCRMIAASDWESRPNKKRWNRLMNRKGFTFLQIERKVNGKNSLDYALFDMALNLKKQGVQKFIIITTDSDFAQIVNTLKADQDSVYVVGVGTHQARAVLREACDKFICYPPLEKEAGPALAAADLPAGKAEEKPPVKIKLVPRLKVQPAATSQAEVQRAAVVPADRPAAVAKPNGNLQVNIPKSLYRELQQRAQDESVGLDQLVTYMLTRGLENL